MSIDRKLLAYKLRKYREQFQISMVELSEFTGINQKRLTDFENAVEEPNGDEILILADFYKCDYKFFISNQKVAPFEQTELLFRKHGDEFSRSDRWAIQEVLYLAECEWFLLKELNRKRINFRYVKQGDYYKKHGIDAAELLRNRLGYQFNEVRLDVYDDFRKVGVHLFRRKLENSNISGVFIKHPVAGKCVLVNYSEDIYRQRFTAAHEVGHSIFDDDNDFVVSFVKWDRKNLVEIRANTFASNYLMPPDFLKAITDSRIWNTDKAIDWANRLKVSTEALANSLSEHGLIDNDMSKLIKSVRVPRELKSDPELSGDLSAPARERKQQLLEHGLSSTYVNLCLDAFRQKIITPSRMAEMLLGSEQEVWDILKLFNEGAHYGS